MLPANLETVLVWLEFFALSALSVALIVLCLALITGVIWLWVKLTSKATGKNKEDNS